MKHVEALNDYINHALKPSEKEYLIKLLNDGLSESVVPAKACVLEMNDSVEAKHEQVIAPTLLEFFTLNKRVIKYAIIQKKLLIQKPKTLLKLRNSVKQIGQGDGGFADSTVNSIIDILIQNNVLTIDSSENVEWLR
ncbi:hypothetical protein V6380_16970 [Acinetobacter variabilis]|uniref:hypothetical protein n=1 Tax=Acinetobacter variabilis TaxID=70346 RepID=UPI003B83A889